MLQSLVSFCSEVPSVSKSHANPCVCPRENVVFPFLQEIPSALFFNVFKIKISPPLGYFFLSLLKVPHVTE